MNLDEQRFEQVVVNILNNAYRHSKEYSLIHIAVTEEHKSISITIEDEGEGIPLEDLLTFSTAFIELIKRDHELQAELV